MMEKMSTWNKDKSNEDLSNNATATHRSFAALFCARCYTMKWFHNIAVGVFVTDVAHNRCCAGQRNSRRKFWSRKRRRKTKLMTRMIIICFKKKLESLFQGRHGTEKTGHPGSSA
jgi:hypothetical protein